MNFYNLTEKLINFLDLNLKNSGAKNFIVGVSGGLDSAVVSALCKKVQNTETFALIMPNENSSKKNLDDAIKHCQNFDIPFKIINISEFINEFIHINPNPSPLRLGNFSARIRMNLLYDYSATKNALVVGTSNLSERMLGYGTIYGDMACAINPIGEIFKTEIFEFAKFLNIDENIINKAPSADLWEGQSDENDLGFSYKDLDQILNEIYKNDEIFKILTQNLNDKNLNIIEKFKSKLTVKFGENITNLAIGRISKNSFKLNMPKIAKIR